MISLPKCSFCYALIIISTLMQGNMSKSTSEGSTTSLTENSSITSVGSNSDWTENITTNVINGNASSIIGHDDNMTTSMPPPGSTAAVQDRKMPGGLIALIVILLLFVLPVILLCTYWIYLYRQLKQTKRRRKLIVLREQLPKCCGYFLPSVPDESGRAESSRTDSSKTARMSPEPVMEENRKGRVEYLDSECDSSFVRSEGPKAVESEREHGLQSQVKRAVIEGPAQKILDPFGGNVDFESIYDVRQITQKDESRGMIEMTQSELPPPPPVEVPTPFPTSSIKAKPPKATKFEDF